MTLTHTTPQKLYLLPLATATVTGATRTLEMILGCYLIETSDGKHILIDSGLPPNAPSPMPAIQYKPEKNVIERLNELGLPPRRYRYPHLYPF